MQEIIPAFEGVWTQISKTRRKPVHRITVPIEPSAEADLPALVTDCQRIVVTTITAETEKIALILRKHLVPHVPMIIYLSGDATEGFHSYGPLSNALTKDDAFVVASESDAAATRRCFPCAHIAVAPFALVNQFKLNNGRTDPALMSRRLVYAGRISGQKNLHTLLFAIWILNTFHTLPSGVSLDVYGRADNLGSPNMGLTSQGYDVYLTELARRLGLHHMVRWHGFKSRDWLFENVHQQPHIFVSPSLHSDENFGSSALASLVNANPVVTTAWGGHFGFEAWFPDQLLLTPVNRSTNGPVVSAVSFAANIGCAIEHMALNTIDSTSLGSARAAFSEQQVATRTAGLLDRPIGQREPLLKSDVLKCLEDRRARFGGGRKIFEGYDDPLAHLFFETYGMDQPLAFDENSTYILPPWVKPSDQLLSIDDPHRGQQQMQIDNSDANQIGVRLCPSLQIHPLPKRLLQILVAQGYAFPTPQSWTARLNEGSVPLTRKSAQ